MHPYSYFLLREQFASFESFLFKRLKGEQEAVLHRDSQSLSIRLRNADVGATLGIERVGKSELICDYHISIDNLKTLPFSEVEGRMSKIIRKSNPDEPAIFRPLFSVPEAHDFFYKLLRGFFEYWGREIYFDLPSLTEIYRDFKGNQYRNIWVKTRNRLAYLDASVELEYDLNAYSMKKSIVIIKHGEEIDRSIVIEDSPIDSSLSGTFNNLRIEGKEIVVGNGTWRYEPFGTPKIVSLPLLIKE